MNEKLIRFEAWTIRLLVVLILALAVLVVVNRVLPRLSSGGNTASKTVVVRRGETLISIAETAFPGRNPYPIIYKLERQTGGMIIYPGERLRLPSGG